MLLAADAAPDVTRDGDDGPRVDFKASLAADAAGCAGGEVLAVLEGAAWCFEAAWLCKSGCYSGLWVCESKG